MKTITVGLIKGRHDMPVDSYIFDEDINPMDFDVIEDGVVDWINSIGRFKLEDSFLMFPYLPEDGGIQVVLYVTGLSAALASVIRWCAKCHIFLTLMHYDKETGEYKPQEIID